MDARLKILAPRSHSTGNSFDVTVELTGAPAVTAIEVTLEVHPAAPAGTKGLCTQKIVTATDGSGDLVFSGVSFPVAGIHCLVVTGTDKKTLDVIAPDSKVVKIG